MLATIANIITTGHRQNTRSAILATAGLLVMRAFRPRLTLIPHHSTCRVQTCG